MENNLPVKSAGTAAATTENPKDAFMRARARAINESMRGEFEVVVKVPAKRFMAQVRDNKLAICDSATGLIEVVSEPYAGHGMMIREPGSFNRTFGGYGAIVDEAKKRLVIRAANGERRGGTRFANADVEEERRQIEKP